MLANIRLALGGDVNPLVPAGFDVAHTVIILALLALFVAAAVSILRSPRYTAGGKSLWLLVVLLLQVVGPIVWFAVGRRARIRTDAP